jgi:hypothetical protein
MTLKQLHNLPKATNCRGCGSRFNSPTEGGTKNCFHCGDCGWVECADYDPFEEDEE